MARVPPADRARAEIAQRARQRIKRDAFLYLEPEGNGSAFAQCSTCTFGRDTCGVMGGAKVSSEDGSCGVYVEGAPINRVVAHLSRSQVGYVERPVRCENCRYGGEKCALYAHLNKLDPAAFDLDERIEPKGCCNAQQPKGR